MRILVFIVSFLLFVVNANAQTVDSANVIPKQDILLDTIVTKKTEPDSGMTANVSSVSVPISKMDSTNGKTGFKINKRDSVFYVRMLNIGMGPSILNLESPTPNYWKKGVGFSIGYTEAITKWLRFNVNLDYTTYKFNKSNYLDKYAEKLHNDLNKDTLYFTQTKRTNDPNGVQAEIQHITDTSSSFVERYVSNYNSTLGIVQIGFGLQIRPINTYFIQPYGLLGFNVNITTNSVTLLSNKPLELNNVKVKDAYFNSDGDYVNETYEHRISYQYQGNTYFNNSIDGGLGMMFGFGCDVFLLKKFGLYGEFRQNVAKKSWSADYGSFQYGISTIRFGIRYRIK